MSLTKSEEKAQCFLLQCSGKIMLPFSVEEEYGPWSGFGISFSNCTLNRNNYCDKLLKLLKFDWYFSKYPGEGEESCDYKCFKFKGNRVASFLRELFRQDFLQLYIYLTCRAMITRVVYLYLSLYGCKGVCA